MCAEVGFSVAPHMQRDNLLMCSRAVYGQKVSNLICRAKGSNPNPPHPRYTIASPSGMGGQIFR